MTFKTNWLSGETGHTAAHNEIGTALNAYAATLQTSGALTPTGGDDSAMVQDAINTYSVVNFGPGVFRCSAVTIPSNRKLHGYGWATQIYDFTATDDDQNGQVPWAVPEVFQLTENTSRVIISDMAFTGRHLSGWTNAQMASIGIRGIACADVMIKDCLFENLVGFSVHQEGFGYNTLVKDCTFRNTGNGLNINGASMRQVGNYMYHCEGIECSGPGSTVEGNQIEDCYTSGISVGGSVYQGRGMTVRGNVIRNTTGASCIGIALGDGLQDCVIDGNIITGPGVEYSPAIVATVGDFHGMKGIVVSNNHISDYSRGIYISDENAPGLSIQDVSIQNNRIGYEADTDVDFPIVIGVPNVLIQGNFARGINSDVYLMPTAVSTRLWRNDIRADRVTVSEGATIAAEPVIG